MISKSRRIVRRLGDFQVTSRGESYADQVIFVDELFEDMSDFQVTSRGESYAGQVIFTDKLYAD